MKQMTLQEQTELIERYGLKPACPLYTQAAPNEAPLRVVGFSLVRDEHGEILGLILVTESSLLNHHEPFSNLEAVVLVPLLPSPN